MSGLTYRDMLASWYDTPTWEKRKSIEGLRHNKTDKWVNHRFPVKGGFTRADVILHRMQQSNPLLDYLSKRGAVK